jgi:tRNA pseudouridine13 synthase
LIERFYPANDKVLNFKFVQNDEDFIVEEQAIKFSGAWKFFSFKS